MTPLWNYYPLPRGAKEGNISVWTSVLQGACTWRLYTSVVVFHIFPGPGALGYVVVSPKCREEMADKQARTQSGSVSAPGLPIPGPALGRKGAGGETPSEGLGAFG